MLYTSGEWTQYQSSEEGPRYDRVALKEGDRITSGDMVEVELQLESKNDYEYLAFEDMKPAGCEPVALRSGGRMGLGVYSDMELRDQKVAFFISYMPQGTRTLTYRLRAEIPGQFHVLPTNGYAMYAPDIRCLSREMQLNIKDAEPVRAVRETYRHSTTMSSYPTTNDQLRFILVILDIHLILVILSDKTSLDRMARIRWMSRMAMSIMVLNSYPANPVHPCK